MSSVYFKVKSTPWREMAPGWLQAAASHPLPIEDGIYGRIELVIGKLGAGKTTWASTRARRLAQATGRAMWTTGEDWPEPWRCVTSWDDLFTLRDAVVVIDEVHLIAPSTRALLPKEVERRLVAFLSTCRKRKVCVLSTTQAWTRVAMHYRQLVTTVWLCRPHVRGRLHVATAHDHPDEGGEECFMRQWYNPADAAIPTNAGVWVPYDIEEANLGGSDDLDHAELARLVEAPEPPELPGAMRWVS